MARGKYSRAWLHRDRKQVEKLGERKAAWYVAWIDPETRKRRTKKIGTKTEAERYRVELQKRLNEDGMIPGQRSWKEFREEYSTEVLIKKRPRTQESERISLDIFEKSVSPSELTAVNSRTLDRFVASRLKEKKSPATINKDLRVLRLFLNVAAKRKYLSKCPEIPFLREPSKVPTFLTDEQLAKIYAACEGREDQKYWQALLVFLRMTGWRIGEALALKWSDVDFDRGLAITRADDNKSHKDSIVPLHSLALEHLEQLDRSTPFVFPWSKSHKLLLNRFHELQK